MELLPFSPIISYGVSAEPADWSHDREVPRGARLAVHVTTSAGDAEQLWLRGPDGPCRSNPFVLCHAFNVVFERTAAAYDLLAAVASLPAGFGIMVEEADSTLHASVHLFAGDVERAMRTVRRWPGVRSVDLAGMILLNPGLRTTHGFRGGLPVSLGTPRPGDGVLQVSDGVTVTVRYLQPDGSVLSDSRTLSIPGDLYRPDS